MNDGASHAAGFSITRTAGSDTSLSITFYLDGEELGTFSNDEGNQMGRLYYGQDFRNSNILTGNWDVYAYDGAVSASEITVANITNIPEPTVLALLALGVAGLALRRRAA